MTTATVAPTKNAPGIVLRTSAYRADPTTIARKPGWNPRFDFGEIEELAKSLKANGVLNPLRVKRLAKPASIRESEVNGGALDIPAVGDEPAFYFELIDGDRRLTAIEHLLKGGFKFDDGVPLIIVDKAQSDLDSLFQMFEANTGKNFLPLEEAAAYKRMRDGDPENGVKGLTIKQICDRVSRKQVHVVATLALLEADDDVKDAIKDGSVNSTMAKKIAVAARGDKAKQKELVAAAKSAGKDKGKLAAVKRKVDDTRIAKATAKGKTLKMRALADDELSALGAGLAASMTVKLKEAGKPLTFDVREWVSKDDKLALAFTFGALEALKAAAGVKTSLDI